MLTDRRQINKLAFLFMLTYMVSYLTRINYGAVVAEMVVETGISKPMLSLALTGSFITYGVGQIISGICGDKFSPKKLVTLGLTVTVLMNALIPLCQDQYQMLAVWCVNGFAQSFMWPPIVKLMTGLLTSDDYNKVMVKVQLGSSFGTIAIYLLAPLLISISSWRLVFIFCAAVGAIMIVCWNIFGLDVPVGKRDNSVTEASSNEKMPTTLKWALVLIMLAIIVMGMLRDGVNTWMPSYIDETYDLGSVIAILTGVVLPIIAIFCFRAASFLYTKNLHNPSVCSIVFFGTAAVASLILVLTTGKSAVLSVLLFSILSGCMSGVNMMLICTVPRFFKKGGKVSSISGILNACTYVGSALSTYGIAILAEGAGWTTTLLILFILAAAGTLLTVISAFPWNKVFGNNTAE